MNDIFSILLWPSLACLVLTGIHAYLGLHVVERGVIFVDLSLAQIAALGAAIGSLMGHGAHPEQTSYFFSLGFTLAGAAAFAFTRSRRNRVPQEAVIGIVYAVSAAAAVLVMNELPQGAEHFQDVLVGNLLGAGPHDVMKMAALYSVIGVLHWFWRKPFLAISTRPKTAAEEGYNLRLWDFLFYGTFGVVVTSSVAIAGVLLVFCMLIVPAVGAMLFSGRIGVRLTIGWVMGVIASLAGVYASYHLDTPTGATVICTFGLALTLMATAYKVRERGSR
jgi:zinc/manganese transport system permease protein